MSYSSVELGSADRGSQQLGGVSADPRIIDDPVVPFVSEVLQYLSVFLCVSSEKSTLHKEKKGVEPNNRATLVLLCVLSSSTAGPHARSRKTP